MTNANLLVDQLLKTATVWLLAMLLFVAQVSGQVWETTLGGDGTADNSSGNVILELDNGDFLIAGTSDYNHPDSIYVAKISWDGSLIWERNYAPGSAYNLRKTGPNRYTIVGAKNSTQQAFFGTINENGEVLDYWEAGTGVKGHDFIIMPDSSIIICGTNSFSNHSILLKVDPTGALIWQNEYDLINARLTGLLLENNYIYASGVANDSVVLFKINPSGNVVWRHSYIKDYSWGNELRMDQNGNFVIVCADASSSYSSNISILKLDTAGGLITTHSVGSSIGVYYEPFGFTLTDDSGCVVSGSKRLNCCDRTRFLIKLDQSGNVVWERTYYDPYPMPMNNGCRTIQTSDGGFATAGRIFGGNGNNYKLSATRVNEEGHVPTNLVSGMVYIDYDGDCVKDPLDIPIPNALISIDNGAQYAFTDEFGYYRFKLDSGQFDISISYQNELLSAACPAGGSYTIALNGFHLEELNQNFSLEPLSICPSPVIEFGTPELSPCAPSAYHFNYANTGTDTSFGTSVLIELDTFVSLTAVSEPHIVYEGKAVVELGNLAPMQQGQFIMTVDVDCNAPLYSTAYMISRMQIDSVCNPDPNWDGSDIEIDALCIGDSIEFIIRNVAASGLGDMDTTRHYRVYEDNIVHLIDPFQLNGGDSITVKFPVNGQTYTLRADEDEEHPLQKFAQKHVERCGGTLYSTGIMQQFTQPDAHPSIEIDLQMIEPNQPLALKSVHPVGFLTNHIVSDHDDLEYTIYFEKENSMLPFEISDTLSAFVDPFSLQVGASSHNYSFDLTSNGVARWKLTDYDAVGGYLIPGTERGFVKYRISQIDSNPTGTVIEARAALNSNYSPVLNTNQTFNTVFNSECTEFSNLGIEQSTDSMYAVLPQDSVSLLCNLKFDAACLSFLTLNAPNHGNLNTGFPECIAYQPHEAYEGRDTFSFCMCADVWCDTIIAFYEINGQVQQQDTNWYSIGTQSISDVIVQQLESRGEASSVSVIKVPKRNDQDAGTQSFVLYPNIAAPGAKVNLNSNASSGVNKFYLFDIYGKLVLSRNNVNRLPIQINTNNLSTGTYFYQLWSETGQSYTGKLLIR